MTKIVDIRAISKFLGDYFSKTQAESAVVNKKFGHIIEEAHVAKGLGFVNFRATDYLAVGGIEQLYLAGRREFPARRPIILVVSLEAAPDPLFQQFPFINHRGSVCAPSAKKKGRWVQLSEIRNEEPLESVSRPYARGCISTEIQRTGQDNDYTTFKNLPRTGVPHFDFVA